MPARRNLQLGTSRSSEGSDAIGPIYSLRDSSPPSSSSSQRSQRHYSLDWTPYSPGGTRLTPESPIQLRNSSPSSKSSASQSSGKTAITINSSSASSTPPQPSTSQAMPRNNTLCRRALITTPRKSSRANSNQRHRNSPYARRDTLSASPAGHHRASHSRTPSSREIRKREMLQQLLKMSVQIQQLTEMVVAEFD